MGRIRVCFTGYSDIRIEDYGELAHALGQIISRTLRSYNLSQFYFTGQGEFDNLANLTVKAFDFVAAHNRRERVFYCVDDVAFENYNKLKKQYDKVLLRPMEILRLCDVLVSYGSAFNQKSAQMVIEAKKLYKPIIYI